MASRQFRRRTATVLCAALVTLLSMHAGAHDLHVVGPFRMEIGWGEEPAFSGMRNSVVVEIADAATHAPVQDLGGGSLTAEVSFGGEHVTLPLRPAGIRSNQFRAWIVPTRAGQYSFHITGTVKNTVVDITSTCSEKSFDCVVNGSEIQFPSGDPSAGELSQRIERSLPRAERALAVATRAQAVAFSAIVVAVLAVGIAVGLAARRKKDA